MANLRRGNKRYEGTNHLGNVLVVYSDKRLIGACNADTALYYKADLIAATDYSPFGAPIKQFYASGDTGCVPYTYMCQSIAVASSFDNYVTKVTNTIVDGDYVWKPLSSLYNNLDTITVDGNLKLKVNAAVSTNERFALLDFEIPAGASCTLTFDLMRYTGSYKVTMQYYYNTSGSSYTKIGNDITFNTNGTQTFIFTANSTKTKHRLRWLSGFAT